MMHSKKKNFKAKCVVPSCTAAKYAKDSFCFPISDNNLLLWLYKINNDDTWVNSKLGKTQYICSSHFKPSELESGYDKLPMDTLPSINLGDRSRHRSLNHNSSKKDDHMLRKQPLIQLYPLCSVCLRNKKCVTMTQKWDKSSKSEILISDVVFIITGVKVSTSHLTLSICDTCLDDLRVAYEFRNKFKNSYDVFKLSLKNNENEIIDLDNYCDRNYPQITTANENLTTEVKLEITKQITTIVDTIIMPKLNDWGVDVPHDKVNGVEFFKALVSGSAKKCHTSTQTSERHNPTPESQSMLKSILTKGTIATESPVIILDIDDTETGPVSSLSAPKSLAKVANLVAKEKEPVQTTTQAQNNFGIVYPKNIPATNEAALSTLHKNKNIAVSQMQSNGENIQPVSSAPPSTNQLVSKLDKTKQNSIYRQNVPVVSCTPQAKKPRLKNTTTGLNDVIKMPKLIPLLPKPVESKDKAPVKAKETSVIVSMCNSVAKSNCQTTLGNSNAPSLPITVVLNRAPKKMCPNNGTVAQKKVKVTSTCIPESGPPITKQPPHILNHTLNIPITSPNLNVIVSNEPGNVKKQDLQSNSNVTLNTTNVNLNIGTAPNRRSQPMKNIILSPANHQNLLNKEQNIINNQNMITNSLINRQVMEPSTVPINSSYLAPMTFNQIPVVSLANNNNLLINNPSQVIIASASNPTTQYNDRGYFVYQPQNGQNKLSQYIIQERAVLPVASSQSNVTSQQTNHAIPVSSAQSFPAYSVMSSLPHQTASAMVTNVRYPDFEDLLSQNYISVDKSTVNAVGNQMVPRIEKVQSIAVTNPIESSRIKVRNLSELT